MGWILMDFCGEWIIVPILLFSLDMQNWSVKRMFPTSLGPDVGHGHTFYQRQSWRLEGLTILENTLALLL